MWHNIGRTMRETIIGSPHAGAKPKRSGDAIFDVAYVRLSLFPLRVTADRNHVHEAALLLLYGIATVAMGFAGYTSALAGTRNRVPVTIMALTIVTVITLVMDLDRPRRGFVTVSQQPMVDLRAGL
jgi:hypothetical protein